MSNAVPVAELWNVNPFDCMSYCILNTVKGGVSLPGLPEGLQDGCAAAVYHKNFQTCQLYNHDGTLGGAKVVYATGHDYYNRTSFQGICSDPKGEGGAAG